MNFIMTEGGKRREGILSLLEDTNMPLSGTELARHFNVSRQVIVQDIALLRAEDQKILSTYRGYVLEKDQVKKKNISGYSAFVILQKIQEMNCRLL